MKKYLCPLCKSESAYVAEYGLADSVICKCKGLNEVGRLVNGMYQPINQNRPSSTDIVNKVMDMHIEQTLQSQGRMFRPNRNTIPAGDYLIRQLTTENEIVQTGQKFQNALSVVSQVQSYLSKGTIWVAENQRDDEKSIVFFITHQKELQNFYLKRNATPDPQDRQTVVEALRKQNLINN